MIGWNEEIKKHLGSCGKNVYIGHNVLFTRPQDVHLGDNVRIDPFTLITSKLKTGNNVQICSHAVLGGGDQWVNLSDWTFIGYGSKLFTASEDYSGEHGPVNEFWNPDNKIYRGDIIFNKYCGVASDVIVFPGIELPEGVCIGAKSLVTSNKFTFESKSNKYASKMKFEMEPYTVYTGNPLRFLKNRNRSTIRKTK